jgi:hypothetical protein
VNSKQNLKKNWKKGKLLSKLLSLLLKIILKVFGNTGKEKSPIFLFGSIWKRLQSRVTELSMDSMWD